MSGPLGFDDDPPRRSTPAPAPGAAPPAPPPAKPPQGLSRYTWFIGVVAVALVVLVTLNAVGNQSSRPGGPQAGEKLPPFAAPLAGAPAREDDDANLHRKKACAVRGPGILNVCQEAERGPVVLAVFPTEAGPCRAVLAQFDRLAPRHRGVRFVAVGTQGKRADLTKRRHPYPVGWDRDGGLAAAYGLVGCPQITFAERGGVVVTTTHKTLSDAELTRQVQRLEQ